MCERQILNLCSNFVNSFDIWKYIFSIDIYFKFAYLYMQVSPGFVQNTYERDTAFSP